MTKKTKTMMKADSIAQAAAICGVSISTVRRAKRKGCKAFIHGRVHLGQLREWLDSNPPKNAPAVKAAAAQTLPTGAAAALARLEQTEADLYRVMLESGGEPEARQAWLSVSDALRKGDLALEQSKKDFAEKWVSREEVKKALPKVMQDLFFQLDDWLHRDAAAQLQGMTAVQIIEKAQPLIDELKKRFRACLSVVEQPEENANAQ